MVGPGPGQPRGSPLAEEAGDPLGRDDAGAYGCVRLWSLASLAVTQLFPRVMPKVVAHRAHYRGECSLSALMI